MSLLNTRSLAETVNAIEESFFSCRAIRRAEAAETAGWIVGRIGQAGGYAQLPATTQRDRRQGGRLFTGERLFHAACRHVFGEEACRALLRLNVGTRQVQAGLQRAQASILDILHSCDQGASRLGRNLGTFCCGTCSVAVWRNLLAGGLDRREERLAAGVESLRAHRDGKGAWRYFPFGYTVLALLEMEFPAARRELEYAARRCENMARRTAGDQPYAARRQAVAQRALTLL